VVAGSLLVELRSHGRVLELVAGVPAGQGRARGEAEGEVGGTALAGERNARARVLADGGEGSAVGFPARGGGVLDRDLARLLGSEAQAAATVAGDRERCAARVRQRDRGQRSRGRRWSQSRKCHRSWSATRRAPACAEVPATSIPIAAAATIIPILRCIAPLLEPAPFCGKAWHGGQISVNVRTCKFVLALPWLLPWLAGPSRRCGPLRVEAVTCSVADPPAC